MNALHIYCFGVFFGFAGAAIVHCGGTREPRAGQVAVSPVAAAPSAVVVLTAADAGAPLAVPRAVRGPALLRLGHRFTSTHPATHHTWRLVDGLYWQADSPVGAPPPDAAVGAPCPADMVHASGDYLLDPTGKDTEAIREFQDATCTKWRGKSQVCEEFDEKRWASMRKRGKRRPMNVCVDRYEYPNQAGEYPMVVVSHTEATALCKKQHKRLCTESEWTFACEGPDATPYPYGYVRSASKCTIDVTTAALADDALWPRNTERAARNIDKAFHATPSGARAECKSPFGVFDMTGNLDEWTQTTRPGSGYASILKGGFWSKVRARCRPQTRAHGPVFVTYETGFRCCADPAP